MNTKQSSRLGTLRGGILGMVLLGSLAVSHPAEANSCNVSVILPTNQSSAVCGASIAENVPYAAQGTLVGTLIATDQADLGVLHALTQVNVSVPTFTYFAGCCPGVSQIGVNQNGSTFTFDDLVVTGPSGTVGTPVNLSFNFALSGEVSTPTSGTNMFSQSGVTVYYNLAGTSGQGSLGATNGVYSSTGFLAGLGTGINNIIGTANATVMVGTPFSFSLGLQEVSLANASNCYDGGGCVGSATATSDLTAIVGLPTTGTVANLPQGYTLGSSSGLIVNNQFVSTLAGQTPEPSTLLLFGTGLLAMVHAARRKWQA